MLDIKPSARELRKRRGAGVPAGYDTMGEVRGYARSGGTTSDLARLHRFANLYQNEKGRFPNRRIYIVNGQLELLPSQRQRPLAPSPEDVDEFAESGGLIIWTLDLFRTVKATSPSEYNHLRESIKDSNGRWASQIGEAFQNRLSGD